MPVSWTSEWVGACRDLSGAFSAWARRVEGGGVGSRTDTAPKVSRLATTHATNRSHTSPAPALAGAAGSGGRLATDVALLLHVAAGNTSSRQFEALLALQLGRMLDAVLKWHARTHYSARPRQPRRRGNVRRPATSVNSAHPIDVRDHPDERWTTRVQQILGQGMTPGAAEEQAAAERAAAERTAGLRQ